MFTKAAFPSGDICDAKGMCIEQSFPNAMTPEDLLKVVRDVEPQDREDFLTKAGTEGVYSFDADSFDAMQEFQWQQLYGLGVVRQKAKAKRVKG
jgi:hypothetical protein